MSDVPSTIFYSWQSDRPSKTNRNLVDSAIKLVVKQLSTNMSILEATRGKGIVKDNDTSQVPGSPSITATILRKIEKATVYVADLTFVAKSDSGRFISNPNVLLEYGYALKSLGTERVIAVMNEEYGAATETSLPFNLRHVRRPILFTLKDGEEPAQRKLVQENLAKVLKTAIELILDSAGINGADSQDAAHLETKCSDDCSAYFQAPSDPLVPNAGRHNRPIHLMDWPCLYLRVMPRGFVPGEPFEGLDLRDKLKQQRILPLGGDQASNCVYYSRNAMGALAYSQIYEGEDDLVFRCLQALRNGELWAISIDSASWPWKGAKGRPSPVFPIQMVEKLVSSSLPSYVKFIRDMYGFSGGFDCEFGLVGVNGYRLAIHPPLDPSMYMGHEEIAMEDSFQFRETLGPEEDAVQRYCSAMFGKLWSFFGVKRPQVLLTSEK